VIVRFRLDKAWYDSSSVRVRLMVAEGGITQEGPKEFVAEATEIVSWYAGDATQVYRIWLIVTEARAGWSVNGEVLTKKMPGRSWPSSKAVVYCSE
jgi:hypothetical protein